MNLSNKLMYAFLTLPLIVFFIGMQVLPEVVNILFGSLFILYSILGVVFYKKDKMNFVIYLVFLQGILLKLFYIFYTPFDLRQHDIGNFTNDGRIGHFNYIYYVLTKGTLPFFHQPPNLPILAPPLHYVIAAIFLKIGTTYEGLQFLSVFYSMGISLFSFLILDIFIKKRNVRLLTACFCVFFPFFIVLSGSLNNDVLFAFLSVVSFYYFFLFLQNKNRKHFILSAVFLGISGMVKFNALSIYFGIGLFYLLSILLKFIKIKSAIKQILIYSLVCLPMLLIWPIYNFFKWGDFNPIAGHKWGHMGSWKETIGFWFSGYNPFLHLENITFDKYQYVGSYSLFERLGIIFSPLSYPYFLTGYWSSTQIPEYNIWLGLIKTALFDEWAFFKLGSSFLHTVGFDLSVILLGLGYILFFFMAISFFRVYLKTPQMLFSFSIIFALISSFVHWNLTNPVWSACNFRYIIPIFPCCCLFVLKYYQDILIKNKKAVGRKILEYSVSYFIIISCLIYIIFGFL